MRNGTRADIAARVFLTLGALLPYWRLLTLRVIYVTDDYFASDIFNGELPGRALIGHMIRHGQLPLWTNRLCSGIPLAGSPADPIGIAAFSLLSPAAALDLFVMVLLLVAAHGAYGLARRFGANRTGAVLSGLAFAGSGYIAAQLKHLSIISTIVWLPVGLVLLDRALGAGALPDPQSGSDAAREPAPTPARRALFMATFGLVFAEQALSGFPQSAYICALVYCSCALFRAIRDRQRLGPLGVWLALLGGIGLAAALGAASGAVVLLPLAKLGSVSDRAEPLGWVWATRLAYWPPNVLTFLDPYLYGDISNNTYVGPPFFWEDYGYVGIATFVLAVYGSVRERRRATVAFSIVMTLVAYLFVLGAATPVFKVAYLLLPGMKLFRFPTRFLIVVDLGFALLAGVGLTRLGTDLGRLPKISPRAQRGIVLALCVGTALDLFIHQPRQNPMVPARDWLAPPATVSLLRADTPEPRTFTPRHRDLHRRAFQVAHGWVNVAPYFELRNVLEPNIGGAFWNIASADCYAGVAPSWYVDVWGDHNREASLMSSLTRLDFNGRTLLLHPALANVMRTYGVTHVLSVYPEKGSGLVLVSREQHAYIYRVDDARRVRFVRAARRVSIDADAAARLLDPDFDPGREILLHDAPESVHPTVDDAPAAAPSDDALPPVITFEDQREVVIAAEAPEDGFLLLADTFFPGWMAEVDGNPVPIYRANISVRGVQLPRGRHEVRFIYEPPAFARGVQISVVAISLLLLWAVGAAYLDRRAPR